MNATPRSHPHATTARRRRGTAMPETVLVLPLLLVIVAMVLYFGRGMLRVQRTQVMDRAEAWRGAGYQDFGSFASREGDLSAALRPRDPYAGLPLTPPHGDLGNNPQLNTTFLGDKADSILWQSRPGFADVAGAELIGEAEASSPDTGALARAQLGYLPTSGEAHFTTGFPGNGPVLGQFNGSIDHGSTRIAHDWTYANGWRVLRIEWAALAASGQFATMSPYPSDDPLLATKLLLQPLDPTWEPTAVPGDGGGGLVIHREYGYDVWQHTMPRATSTQAIRDVFLLSFDQAFEPVAQDNRLARQVRGSYLHQPPYLGPTLETPPPD